MASEEADGAGVMELRAGSSKWASVPKTLTRYHALPNPSPSPPGGRLKNPPSGHRPARSPATTTRTPSPGTQMRAPAAAVDRRNAAKG